MARGSSAPGAVPNLSRRLMFRPAVRVNLCHSWPAGTVEVVRPTASKVATSLGCRNRPGPIARRKVDPSGVFMVARRLSSVVSCGCVRTGQTSAQMTARSPVAVDHKEGAVICWSAGRSAILFQQRGCCPGSIARDSRNSVDTQACKRNSNFSPSDSLV